MKIRGKIFFPIMITAFVLFIGVIGYLGYNFRSSTLSSAKTLADSYAKQSANTAKAILDGDMATVKSIADIFSDYQKIPANLRTPIYDNILKKIIDTNPKFLAVWVSWELSAVDNEWTKPYGRERTEIVKISGGSIQTIKSTLNTDGDDLAGVYYRQKISENNEFFVNPYFYSYETEDFKDSILEASLAVHIRKDGEFIGLAGIDVELTELQSIIETEIPFDSSYMFLIANNGFIAAHQDDQILYQEITDVFKEQYSEINFSEKIARGDLFSINNKNENGEIIAYTTFAPIHVGNSKTPWSIAVTVPIEEIINEAVRNFYYTLLVGIFGFLILTVVIFFISRNITRPLHKTINVLHSIESGNIDIYESLDTKRKDEIGEMSLSVNKLGTALKNTASFAARIGKGEFDAEYTALGDHDVLGMALIEMRKNLQEAENERQERISDAERRTRFQNGISEIGEIIQRNFDNIEELSFALVKETVKFLEAVQGGMFIIENVDGIEVLKLMASYAYDKKKRLTSTVEIGESLVGRCAKEKNVIHITNIPKGYTFVSSGLGEENPNVLVLAPLIHEQKVFGVLEIASFKHIDEFHIEFLETVGQRIGSVISNMRINEETAGLLEKFKKQSSELEIKEKETSETIENLENAQKEILARESESKGILDAFVSVASVVFYDIDGKITNVNQKKLDLLGVQKEDIIGKTHFDLLDEVKEGLDWFTQFWDDLKNGILKRKESYVKQEEQEFWLEETFIPILDKEGKPKKVINIGIDITKQKLLERELNQKLEK